MSVELVSVYIRLRSKATGRETAPGLRKALVKDTAKRGTNLTDVVVRLLANHYGLEWTPSTDGRKTTPKPDANEINLWLPKPIYKLVSRDAARARPPRSEQHQILSILADHYGITLASGLREKKTRRSRRLAA